MAASSRDSISQYFKKGAEVEISSDEEGFRGSWYAGTVVRPPGNVKRGSAKVLVEYKTLTEDEKGTRPLREELQLVQLRPPPPREKRRSFKFSEEVDAYYSDGWWEGIITEVAGEDKYLVFFRGTREQIAFKASELRLHREWVHGKWVPPLESAQDVTPEIQKLPPSAEVGAEHNFSPGEVVEVSSDEEGFEGAWFIATVVKKLKAGKYLVEYQTLRNDDDTDFLREEVDTFHIRPCPPDVGLVDRFDVLEEVDALYNDGWWRGVISKVLKNDRYSVYFRNTQEELKFEHSDLRVHQDWVNGKWVIASKVIFQTSTHCFLELHIWSLRRGEMKWSILADAGCLFFL
ncbi:UNVERIFIED_CONTAM: protein AGENET DOMAIN (AGD)-CONTAINING P1 [Sesamum radiatum]|uniref:Protein AGENET DOMAIN (AGD)-CONTAINING P1 n=1 Tax=Sesamum radiatum TaxID=300843 RepID=A0AAW2U7F5_SESRA